MLAASRARSLSCSTATVSSSMSASDLAIRRDAPERVERAVDGDAVRPRSELRFPAIRRERPEDLNPHFLRDVGGEVGVADQTPDDGVDVRRVLRPKVCSARSSPSMARWMRT